MNDARAKNTSRCCVRAQKLNVIHHACVDISVDLIAGALLGQVIYWFGDWKDGRSRARIVKDCRLWMDKAR